MKHTVTHRWQRKENVKTVRVRVQTQSDYSYPTTMRKSESLVTYTGEFLIEIDVEAIASTLAARAANNSTGKATYMQGRLRAHRLSMKEVAREEKEYSLPANTTLEPEAKQ